MSKVIRATLSVVFSLVLFSTLTTAQAAGKNAEKDKNKEHHSRFAKAAFWRHHKDADKNAKQAQQPPSKPAQAKAAQIKPVKPATGKKDQKYEQHASNMGKPSAKTAPAGTKTKTRQKTQDPKTVSLKE